MAPYVDIWDHKGPGLFLIEWLGQVIWPGRIGIFIIQVLSLFGTLLCLDSIAKHFISPLLRGLAVIITLAFLVAPYQGGNLTEEYSLFFIALVLMLLTREWCTGKPLALIWFSVAGASFAFLAFIRINNAVPVFAIFLVYFVFALIKKKRVWVPLLISLAGFAATTFAFLAWFALAGSLSEMLYAVFTFNSLYNSAYPYDYNSLLGTPYGILGAFALLLGLVGGIVDRQIHKRQEWFALSWTMVALSGAVMFMNTNAYMHYLQLGLPIVFLGSVLIMQAVKNESKFLVAIVVLLLTVPMMLGYVHRSTVSPAPKNEASYAAAAERILEWIPESDRSQVYGWNLEPKFFLITDTLPIQRFYFLQDKWSEIDPKIKQEVLNFVSDEKPRWVIRPKTQEPITEMQKLLDSNYDLVHENSYFYLYELK
ncbi:hypothetical protein G7068_07305 [Leucobacter viscericola]|uniref:Glycosyltransferase RgtA/B/C/D-like domain-containing protein n=1 Tax=Leucobacter viscericola TaxID=2714935 RepID=A0A6G7XEK5_9MICO|nr:hypothetical protein [Leucobacter viscericola]QIK63024.1 hypothetical protein G7068_07305 [Leucobacter viscericola]